MQDRKSTIRHTAQQGGWEQAIIAKFKKCVAGAAGTKGIDRHIAELTHINTLTSCRTVAHFRDMSISDDVIICPENKQREPAVV